jgi:hypothetical protein
VDDRNLKQEFRRALDSVAPPAPWLATSVLSTLRERRNERWIDRARRRPVRLNFAIAGLTMVVLAILVVAAVVLAQLYLGIPKPVPGGHGLSTAVPSPSVTVAQLEARPLHPPALLAGGVCPADQLDPNTGKYGMPPVYLQGGPYTFDQWGDFYDVTGYTEQGTNGPVLIRGTDIKSANHPVVFQGPYSAGPVFATDGAVQLHTELVLDTTHPALANIQFKGTSYVEWAWRQGEHAGWSGCVYFQADGAGFSIGVLVNQPLVNGRDPNYSGG